MSTGILDVSTFRFSENYSNELKLFVQPECTCILSSRGLKKIVQQHSPSSSPCCGLSCRWHPALASGLQTVHRVQHIPVTLERIPHLGWQTALSHLHSSLRASRKTVWKMKDTFTLKLVWFPINYKMASAWVDNNECCIMVLRLQLTIL